jgi:hypothetical protein
MKAIVSALGALFLSLVLVAPAPAAGLYDDDATKVTGGDLKERDYWRAKWNSIRLEEAIKERQPEGAIMMELIGDVSLLDDLLKKYPNHEDLKKWRARAGEIQKKINPDANRGESFKAGSLWNEHNYREAYVGLNCGKVAMAEQDWKEARSCLNDAERDFKIMTNRLEQNDRVAAWPPDAAGWVKTASAEATQLNEEVAKKLK